MEVLMGIFVKACVAVAVGVICLAGLILYSKKKDREDAQNAGAGGSHDTNSAESQNAAASHMTCSGDCSKCYSHCSSEKKNLYQNTPKARPYASAFGVFCVMA